MNSVRKPATASSILPTLGLLVVGSGIAAIFYHFSYRTNLRSYAPEIIALLLAAGVLYIIAAYVVQRFALGLPALIIILGAGLAFRLIALSLSPPLSADVFRYQWEGRAQRAGINPYTTHPDALRHLDLEDPAHPLGVGRTTPTLYPPLSENSFSWAKTISGYKRLYTGLDVASMVVILLLLMVRKQPLSRVLMYAWNPSVVVAFAMCGHHDSLAILALLAANLLIITQRPAASIVLLALSFLSKFFAALALPVFISSAGRQWQHCVILSPDQIGAKDPGSSVARRHGAPRRSRLGPRSMYAGLFAAIVLLGYLPFANAGRKLLDGLSQYAAAWENNDSLFRLLLLAGNSRPQAGLIAGLFLAALVIWVLKRRLEPLQACFVLLAGLLLLSPNALPWYFTWTIPFLCFYPSRAWLLMSVTCVLGYAPVVAYAAGGPYADSPLILALEYVPVFAWLAWAGLRESGDRKRESLDCPPTDWK